VQNDSGIMSVVFERYIRDILPKLAPGSQKTNLSYTRQLQKTFGSAPIESITPHHIARYRDAKTAKVAANREITILSHVFNLAREWGYTSRENPVRGVSKNKEEACDYHIEKDVWDAVYSEAERVLKDAMDVAYYSGQRPGGVLKMRETDIRDGMLCQAGKDKSKVTNNS